MKLVPASGPRSPSFRRRIQPWKFDRAKQMREQPTQEEAILAASVYNRSLGGFRIGRQRPILGYIADFYCAQKRLVIELDGSHHSPASDSIRDAAMSSAGFTILRFQNSEIRENLPRVLSQILETLRNL